ncbi:MAG: hypothetical protein HYR76_01210 [Ignavibacteria bacterium]|nr:hypothetical protein [Ignavibacteria bacterium]
MDSSFISSLGQIDVRSQVPLYDSSWRAYLGLEYPYVSQFLTDQAQSANNELISTLSTYAGYLDAETIIQLNGVLRDNWFNLTWMDIQLVQGKSYSLGHNLSFYWGFAVDRHDDFHAFMDKLEKLIQHIQIKEIPQPSHLYKLF